MEYQKIINLLHNTPNQPTKFKTKSWVEINDESRGTYNVNSQIKIKTTIYVIIVMHLSLLKEIQLLATQQLQLLMQIIQIEKQYLKLALNLVIA